jgi:hypothetical protein
MVRLLIQALIPHRVEREQSGDGLYQAGLKRA